MLIKAIQEKFDTLRELAAGSIPVSPGWTGVGTALAFPARLVLIQNLTNQAVYFSFDGVNAFLKLPPNGFFLPDGTTNDVYLQVGSRLYAQQSSVTPTTGSVCFTVMYGSDGQ